MYRVPSQLIHLEPEAELIPRRPFGFFPIRFKHLFWEQKYVLEIWHGKTQYARIAGKDSSAVIDVGIEAWKRFRKNG